MEQRLLAIYLNDHLAGGTAGVELARRSARANEGTELGAFLAETLVPELTEDCATLERLIVVLRIKRSRPKVIAAWTAEKLGRLKLNGELHRYSPLSRLLELDGLAVVIELKRGLWLSLESALSVEGFDFASLAERASSQRSLLEEHRAAAAAAAFRSPRRDDAAQPAPSGTAA